ncbi:MAG: biotin--[acetyl-CoA-carboxylase] ligase [Alloprevotella sp.]|nr:biotin--[acetyl-CoA-carboxylase] ligase [Alloprevotella sp.]
MPKSFNIDLPTNWWHKHLSETDSTMLQLRRAEYAHSNYEFVLITTDYQTAGRGQRGTSWEADSAQNLLFGFLFHPRRVPVTHQFALSEALALSVSSALEEYITDVSVKWPNDIYWKDKKICGMLLEHDVCGIQIENTLTGVGLNVNQEAFKSDAPNPVSLKQILGHGICRKELLMHVLKYFEHFYNQVLQEDYDVLHQLYMQHLYCAEGWHTFADENGEFKAMIERISSMGILRLKREDGYSRDYAFKQVKLIKR